MARIISITETAEAITANATVLVWEEYDAPRKRIPRARIVEHAFSVSIPKYDDDAAPVAFVVEHYDTDEKQMIRYAGGKLYTPARFVSSEFGDAEKELQRAFINVGLPEYTAQSYADSIARDDVRADQWHQYGNETAENAEQDAARNLAPFAVIDGELYHQCGEPAYEYHRPYTCGFNRTTTPEYIDVTTKTTAPGHNLFGAFDQIALAFYHGDAEQHARIEVNMPELITIDATARELANELQTEEQSEQTTAESVRRHEEALRQERKELEEQREKVARARADLEAYQTDPRAYWLKMCERFEASKLASIRKHAEHARAVI